MSQTWKEVIVHTLTMNLLLLLLCKDGQGNYSCIPTGEEGRVVGDNVVLDVLMHDNDDDDFQVFDDALPCNEELDNDSNNEDTPYGIILELCDEMQDLRSNPLGLDRFSCEEKVLIELLHVLMELKAPLEAFSCILNWAAKANNQGHVFQVDCQPSQFQRWKCRCQ
jgi:hypothetical protein